MQLLKGSAVATVGDAEGFPRLSHEAWEQLERRVRDFEAAWSRGARPAIDAYLTDDDSGGRLLVELVHADLEFRLRAGERPTVAEYVARYPVLSGYPRSLSSLEDAAREFSAGGLVIANSQVLGRLLGETNARQAEETVDGADSRSLNRDAAELPTLPGYEIVREIARGGMGVVYEAIETRLKRPVALKTVRPGAEREERDRLKREAEAVAALVHPHVVQVHQVLEHDARLYVVSEYLSGGTLAELSNGEPLDAKAAAKLVEPLAKAVAYAHSKGVVHRDLKPSNILLTEDRTPKVADFGLAKRTDDDSDLTRTGIVAGSPSYMAPEQTLGSKEVGAAADVWALGAILYELLTGRPPFRGASTLDTLELVRSTEPVPPRRLVPRLPKDLETICLKCLEKNPARRYLSADDLADDLSRFLRGEVVRARPVSTLTRAARLADRNRGISGLLALLAIAIATGLGASLWQARRANESAESSRKNEQYARRLLFASDMTAAAKSLRDGDYARAAELIDEHAAEQDGPYAFVWNHLNRLTHVPGGVFDRIGGPAYALALSPDGTTLAAGGSSGDIRIYDVPGYHELRRFAASTDEIRGLAFSANGAMLVSAAGDGVISMWEWRTGRQIWNKRVFETWAYQAKFVPGGSVIIACGNSPTIHILDVATGDSVGTLTTRDEAVADFALSSDGRSLYAAGYRGQVAAFDLTARTQQWFIDSGATDLRRLTSVAVSPDGSFAAFGTITSEILFVRTDNGRFVVDLPPAERQTTDAGGVRSLAFLSDGRLAIGTDAGIVRVESVSVAGFESNESSREPNTFTSASRFHGGPVLYLSMDDGDHTEARDGRGFDILSRNFNTSASIDAAPDGRSTHSTEYTGHDYTSVAFPTTTAAMGISLWFRSFHPDSGLFSITENVNDTPRWHGPDIYLIDGHIAAHVDGTEKLITQEDHYADAAWHHVAYSYGPDVGQRLYVDGRLRAEGTETGPNPPKIGFARIGLSPGSKIWGMIGRIDEVRVWDRAISDEEARLLAAGEIPPVEAIPPAVAARPKQPQNVNVKLPARSAWVAHHDRVTALTIAGDHAFSASRDGGLGAWDLSGEAAWRTVDEPHDDDGRWESITTTPTGADERLFAIGHDGIYSVDLETNRLSLVANLPKARWGSILATRDASKVIAGSYDRGLIKAWTVTDGGLHPLWEWQSQVPCTVTLSSSPAANTWIVGWLDTDEGVYFEEKRRDALVRIDAVSGETVAFKTFDRPLSRPALAADGNMVAVGLHADVVLLDARTLDVKSRLTGHTEQVNYATFSPDGKILATSASDGRVLLWDTRRQSLLREFRPDAGVTMSVAFSPNGKFLLTASDEHPPRLWDVETGRLVLEPGRTPYAAHDDANRWSPAYFSADGRFIVAGRDDLLTIFDGGPLNEDRERLSDRRERNR